MASNRNPVTPGPDERAVNHSAYFMTHSNIEIPHIKRTVRLIRTRLARKRDLQEAGVVYVIQATGIDLVKVGFTARDELDRVEEIVQKCDLPICRIWRTPVLYGAYRTEKIVHHLLAKHGYWRFGCRCKIKQHIEWFRVPFREAVDHVQMVYTWIKTQDPYNLTGPTNDTAYGQLRANWRTFLDAWLDSQKTRQPREWIDLFLTDSDHFHGRELFTPGRVVRRSARRRGGSSNSGASSGRGGLYRLKDGSNVRPGQTDFVRRHQSSSRSPPEPSTPTKTRAARSLPASSTPIVTEGDPTNNFGDTVHSEKVSPIANLYQDIGLLADLIRTKLKFDSSDDEDGEDEGVKTVGEPAPEEPAPEDPKATDTAGSSATTQQHSSVEKVSSRQEIPLFGPKVLFTAGPSCPSNTVSAHDIRLQSHDTCLSVPMPQDANSSE